MIALQNLQAQFQTALSMDQAPSSGLLHPSGEAQFAVYRSAYRARLRLALRDNNEALAQIMGDDAFDVLANAYIDLTPIPLPTIACAGSAISLAISWPPTRRFLCTRR